MGEAAVKIMRQEKLNKVFIRLNQMSIFSWQPNFLLCVAFWPEVTFSKTLCRIATFLFRVVN